MRLKQLDLIGYKTFASETTFVFDSGITAIVGPNGSGKSNVADAIRWVLGEQTFSLLRAKKNEDMIFSGSEKRARLGMAQVTITLDNADQWLPVEFSQVTIGRRAFRSGENEYVLNGNKVRLRDVTDLLGKSGLSRRTYTVIGQGLIDIALSLHPHERRALIEEAAGLTLYQSRRADALVKLGETQTNVLRVHDLIAEIAPRVKRLQQQAERAQEHAQITQELDQAWRIWYGAQWRRRREELLQAQSAAQYHQERLSVQRALLTELDAHTAQLRAAQNELRRSLEGWHRQSSALHTRSEALQRGLAVAQERRQMLAQQREQAVAEMTALEQDRTVLVGRIQHTGEQLAAVQDLLERQRAAVFEAQAALDAHRQQTGALNAAHSSAQGSLFALRAEVTDCQNRLAQLDERQGKLAQEQAGHRQAQNDLERQIGVLGEAVTRLDDRLAQLNEALSGLDRRRGEIEVQAAQNQQRQQQARAGLNDLDQQLGRLRERYDLLSRMRDEGAGLYDGVRHVLQAAEAQGANRLSGIVGAAGSLIQVPQQLETAIEVALGGQLQDVVVERWADAQNAIAYLKRTQGGRATFLPLDTLRPGRPLQVTRSPHLIGLASDLVSCEERLRPVVIYLLGRTLVCPDLPAARRVLDTVEGSYQIVTLAGEMVRSSGAVTGGEGRQQRQGGLLAREREWRELPAQIRSLQDRHAAAAQAVEQAVAEDRSLRGEMTALMGQRGELERQRRPLERDHEQTQRQIEQASRELQWHAGRVEAAAGELEELRLRGEAFRGQVEQLTARWQAAQARLDEVQAQLARLDDRPAQAQLAERRAALTATGQEQAVLQAELRSRQQEMQRVGQQIEARKKRLDDLAAHMAQTDQNWQELHGQADLLSQEIQSLSSCIEPAEQQLVELERQQNQMEQDRQQARARLQAVESRCSQAGLELTRYEEAMHSLRRQIQDDLGPVELDMGAALSGQPFLPLGELVSSLPDVQAPPEGLEEQIQAFKRRLRLLGAINPDAPAEYQEARQRHDFLAGQAQDLEQAADQLRQVIGELDGVMEREFKRTFNAVAREFKQYFARLFNGGSAQLELTLPDDLMNTGIDIVARPPGKRQQGLALLSGGERALTAAALIFAILSISPTPFCVLDEVDAALDEANVGRFRQVIKELSASTQFVLITHNRYTIEAADIVYGVSMGADGASCVISHRMPDVKEG